VALASKDIELKEEHPLIVAAGAIGGMLAIGFMRAPASQHFNWQDYSAFAVFGLLLYWLLKPSKKDG
jgi:branched-subunit amino acid ABC-type transport system permease component